MSYVAQSLRAAWSKGGTCTSSHLCAAHPQNGSLGSPAPQVAVARPAGTPLGSPTNVQVSQEAPCPLLCRHWGWDLCQAEVWVGLDLQTLLPQRDAQATGGSGLGNAAHPAGQRV